MSNDKHYRPFDQEYYDTDIPSPPPPPLPPRHHLSRPKTQSHRPLSSPSDASSPLPMDPSVVRANRSTDRVPLFIATNRQPSPQRGFFPMLTSTLSASSPFTNHHPPSKKGYATDLIPSQFQARSITVQCPYCGEVVETNLRLVNGSCVWMCFIVLLMSGFLLVIPWLLCWVPFVKEKWRDVEHYCPRCSNYLGLFRR